MKKETAIQAKKLINEMDKYNEILEFTKDIHLMKCYKNIDYELKTMTFKDDILECIKESIKLYCHSKQEEIKTEIERL